MKENGNEMNRERQTCSLREANPAGPLIEGMLTDLADVQDMCISSIIFNIIHSAGWPYHLVYRLPNSICTIDINIHIIKQTNFGC